MNRSIDNTDVTEFLNYSGVQAHLKNLFQEEVVGFLTKNFYFVFLPVELNIIYWCDLPYFIDNCFIVRCNYLSTIVPIGFVSVIFRWIMRCCNYNSALTFIMPDSKWEFWCRSEWFKEKYFKPVGWKDICSCFGKVAAIVTTIICYCYFNSCFSTLINNVIW